MTSPRYIPGQIERVLRMASHTACCSTDTPLPYIRIQTVSMSKAVSQACTDLTTVYLPARDCDFVDGDLGPAYLS